MSKEPNYISCIACKQALLFQQFEFDFSEVSFELPYCDNNKCNRYRLFVMPLESDYDPN